MPDGTKDTKKYINSENFFKLASSLCKCKNPDLSQIDGTKYEYMCLICGEYAGFNAWAKVSEQMTNAILQSGVSMKILSEMITKF
jgi:hypothetical protein